MTFLVSQPAFSQNICTDQCQFRFFVRHFNPDHRMQCPAAQLNNRKAAQQSGFKLIGYAIFFAVVLPQQSFTIQFPILFPAPLLLLHHILKFCTAAQNQNRCGGSPYEKENNQIFHHSLIFNCFWYSSTLIS